MANRNRKKPAECSSGKRRIPAQGKHDSGHEDYSSWQHPPNFASRPARLVFLFHRGKLRTPASVETALLGDGLNIKETIQTFMVDCLAIFPFLIHEPDAIEAIHLAVVSNPEYPSDLACPRTTRLAPHGKHRAGRNGNRK